MTESKRAALAAIGEMQHHLQGAEEQLRAGHPFMAECALESIVEEATELEAMVKALALRAELREAG